LLTVVSWRLIFFVTVPAGAAALALLAGMERSPRRRTPFDWTGLLFLPMMLTGAALTPSSARVAERAGVRTVVVGGLGLMAVGLAILAAVPSTAPVWALAGLMVPVGLAGPLVIPPVTAVLLNTVPDNQAGTASGVFNTSRQIGARSPSPSSAPC
jgi:MFS family permease